MSVITTAIMPILFLLATGTVLRRKVLTQETFWTGLAWLSYWVFTPALFITTISRVDLSTVSVGLLLLSLTAPILVVAGVALALGRLTRANGPQLTSLVQGAIRINTYIGLIFASALHGQQGVATFALASAVVVPLVNLVCVTTLSIHGDKQGTVENQGTTGKPGLWRDLASNPLILSCLTGLALNVLSLRLPNFLGSTLDLLATPALVCGTLIAGAALRFTFRRRDLLDIGLATILKLAVLPLAAMGIAVPFGVTGPALTSIVLICAVPTAPSAYILAARMGGDTRLMAAITGIQTLLSAASIPAALALAARLGT